MCSRIIALTMPVIVTLTGWLASVSCADEATLGREDQLKAAYLFNFVKFVEWPAAAADQALVLCVIGGEGVHAALAAGIESKKVANRRVGLRSLDSADNLTDCNVLYIDAGAVQDNWQALLPVAIPILTVSDATWFTRSGGMIELFTENNRLRFNVNIDNANNAGLRISSSLLDLAAKVERGERQ